MSADVLLAEAAEAPVVGSFVVDGLTFAVADEGSVELVGVAPATTGEGAANVALPGAVPYEGAEYALSSIGAYAFYLSGMTDVTLPASVSNVDDRAFRSSDVARVAVDADNPAYSSYDGALYSADMTSLLLIPEGRTGAVRVPSHAASVAPSVFSHCAGVDAIAVDAGCSHLSSENGLLYDAEGATLLRVPAGATEVTIREGCTAIAAGALEGCAKLERINAPASVASISPDVFHAIPTVNLPAASVILSEGGEAAGAEGPNEGQASEAGDQITAMVALSSADDDLPQVVVSDITVSLSDDAASDCWESIGFAISRNALLSEDEAPDTQEAATYGAGHSSYVYCENPWYRNSLSSGATLEGPTNEWFHVNGGTMTKFRLHEGVLYFDSSAHGGAYIHIGLTKNLDGVKSVLYGTSTDNLKPLLPSEAFRVASSDTYFYIVTSYDLGFDVDSEPGDADCKGEPKDDQTVNVEDGPTAIEDPKRPGYVFQGWAIPSEDGTEAIDQDLVYQDETDGKWYVDASKLPDYAGDDGRVELTARWSAAVKVDAPLSATFYYDLTLPDGEGYWDEARDAAVEGAAGAAGTAAIRNHSAVPLRVAGMESATGKDSARLLKKGDEWVNDLPKGEASVLSVFPTKSASTGTEDAALGPSSASQGKGDDLAHAVTLALDEVKLEAAFDADAWAIGAATVGDNGIVSKTGDLRLGYRLDLGGEGGITLDYDALLGATEGDEGKAAPLTSIAYCFALQAPRPTGTRSDPLYVEVTDPEVGGVGVYGLADIKAAADDFSSRVDPATDPNDWASISSQIAGSPYAKLYTELLEGGACFKLKVDGAYLDAQLIGICQDARSDNGRRAGLTFQTKDVYAYNNKKSNAAGGGTFNTQMNPLDKNDGGWQAMPLRERLRTTFMNSLDGQLRTAIAPLRKSQQIFGDIGAASLQNTTGKEGETIWLPSRYELSGMIFDRYNESEAIGNSSYKPFQYHAFAGSNGSRLYNKYFNDSIPGWWTRSAYRSNRSIFCQVNGVDGRFSQNAAYAGGVAPCFAL